MPRLLGAPLYGKGPRQQTGLCLISSRGVVDLLYDQQFLSYKQI